MIKKLQIYAKSKSYKLMMSDIFVNFPHLIEKQFAPLLFSQVHLFDGHLFAAVLLCGDAHDARRALANL